ncbi:MAG: RIP metalloprotease RseP [Kiritimatiellae bacterium]|nr:RIP metalloprotease RseP [Kiritimatiellia bacterium]MDW8457945.1 RIP metalloprotease RseP [Verrucomicrobiota bacterium]
MLESIALNAYTLIVVLALFGLTIFVHELGHFLVARWCGLAVDTFAIGFGPAIWRRTIRGVEYKIGILPFGGYVALPQMDPAGGREDSERNRRALPPVAPWRKILVALAGVTCNMILAYAVAHVVYWKGQSFAPPEDRVVLGYVDPDSEAYAAGLRIGDVIVAVNGKPVKTWDEFMMDVALAANPVLTVRHASGEQAELTLARREIMGASFIPGISPMNYCYVLRARPGSSAEAAGLRNGDRVVRFDGIQLYSREHLIQLANERADRPVPIVIEREGRELELTVTPKYDPSVGRALIGIEFNTLDVKKPMDQIKSHALLIVRLLKGLTTPSEAKAAAGAVGGPFAILAMFWLYVQSSLVMALWFTCLLNVNLAILNLLPIPVLDGGHIMLALWEMAARRPASPRVVGWIWNGSAVLLIGLFLFLSWRDINRFYLRRPTPADAEPTATTNPLPAEPASP